MTADEKQAYRDQLAELALLCESGLGDGGASTELAEIAEDYGLDIETVNADWREVNSSQE